MPLFPKYCPGNLGNTKNAFFSQKRLTKMREVCYNKISARGQPFARRRYPGTRDKYLPKRKRAPALIPWVPVGTTE